MSLIAAFLMTAPMAGASADGTAARIFESQAEPAPQSKIDEFVFARLKEVGAKPASLSTDGVFVRRVYLDVIGTLPTAKEAREFIEDRDPNKRRLLIDRLLERDEFADYWAMKWCDLLRVKAEFPINLWPNAAQAYDRWIRTSIKENLPYDKFVREMLTANGSNFRVGQVNFYRAVQNRTPQGFAQAVALTFMGSRAEEMASRAVDRHGRLLRQDHLQGYGRVERGDTVVRFHQGDRSVGGRGVEGHVPGRDSGKAGGQPGSAQGVCRLAHHVQESLVQPQHRQSCMGLAVGGVASSTSRTTSGPTIPPGNPQLLAYLERELTDANYDLKHIYRLILNSTTYQLSSVPKSKTPAAEANFAAYPLRRLEAEVLIDALNQITGTAESYSSAIPEPFTYIPEGQRAIALPDGSITSPFLEQFGRPSRDTGLESERSNRPTADQWLHLLNSSHIQRKIENSPKLQALFQPPPVKYNKANRGNRQNRFSKPAESTEERDPRQIANAIYLTILSRFPTDDELKVVARYVQSATVKREAATDLIWALVNSAEFLYRH